MLTQFDSVTELDESEEEGPENEDELMKKLQESQNALDSFIALNQDLIEMINHRTLSLPRKKIFLKKKVHNLKIKLKKMKIDSEIIQNIIDTVIYTYNNPESIDANTFNNEIIQKIKERQPLHKEIPKNFFNRLIMSCKKNA